MINDLKAFTPYVFHIRKPDNLNLDTTYITYNLTSYPSNFYNDKYHSDLIDTLMPPDHQEEYDQNEPVDGFEIQKLIDYIHTQRRFRADDYTNSYFMSNQNIASYSYYKDFILIQPKSNSGVVHYTYVPVIDDAQFSKVVLVRIDRDGNIDIVNDIEKET